MMQCMVLMMRIVSLPGMIAQSSLDPESVGLVRDYVNELLQYVVSFLSRYLSDMEP